MTESAEKTVNIAYRGTPEFRERLQRVALDRGMKVQELLDEAVENYVFLRTDPSLITKKQALSTADLALAKRFLHWLRNPIHQLDKDLGEMVLQFINRK